MAEARILRGVFRWLRRHATVQTVPGASSGDSTRNRLRVLVLGIYLADRPNTAGHLVSAFSSSRQLDVVQRWVALAGAPADAAVDAVTVERRTDCEPKFTVLNRLLLQHGWQGFDYIVFCDDDIVVPRGFLDAFLSYQVRCDFALAQPERTRTSYADRKFVRAMRGVNARRTRFVEIGPLFSVRADLAALILPFDETSPMGWGYDFVWPVVAEGAGLRLGVVDATAVDHSLRGQATAYSSAAASHAMVAYLQRHRHLTKQEAFTVLETY